MPPLPLVPNVVKIRQRFGIGVDLDCLVVWHMQYTGGPPSDADCAAMAATINGHMIADLESLISTGRSIIGADVTDLSSATGGFGESATTAAGTRTGGELGAAVCMLVSQPIARRYRGGKPRSYWPFGSGTDINNGNRWGSGFTTTVLAALETYLGHLETVTHGTTALTTLVSVSYYQGFTPVTNPVTGRTKDRPKVRTGAIPVDPIISLIPSDKVASQRRRNQQRAA